MSSFDLQTLDIDALAFCYAPSEQAANTLLDAYAAAQGLIRPRRFWFQIRSAGRGKTATMHLGYLAVLPGSPKAAGINVVPVARNPFAHIVFPKTELERLFEDAFRDALADFLKRNGREHDPSTVLGLLEFIGDEVHVYIPTKVRT